MLYLDVSRGGSDHAIELALEGCHDCGVLQQGGRNLMGQGKGAFSNTQNLIQKKISSLQKCVKNLLFTGYRLQGVFYLLF